MDDKDIYENKVIWNFHCKAAKFWVEYGRFNMEAAAMDVLFCRLLKRRSMGKLFGGDSGPSAGDIQRAEEAAFRKESERLRIQEQKLRQRESDETIQGEGVSTAGSITIGSDAEQTNTGGDKVRSIDRGPEAEILSDDPSRWSPARVNQAFADMRQTGLRLRV